jgi:hypothetical protein
VIEGPENNKGEAFWEEYCYRISPILHSMRYHVIAKAKTDGAGKGIDYVDVFSDPFF